MKLKYIKNKRGITLAEVLIAMAFIGILATLAYSLHFFGLKSFLEGGNQAHIQQNVRLASELLRKDIRNTNHIMLIEESQPLPAGYTGYYLENQSLTKDDSSFFTDEIFEDIKISFKGINERVMMFYEIKGLNNYSLKDQILLNNVPMTDIQDKIIMEQVYSLKEYKLVFKQ